MKKMLLLLMMLCVTSASAREEHFAIEFSIGINIGMAKLDEPECLPTNNSQFSIEPVSVSVPSDSALWDFF